MPPDIDPFGRFRDGGQLHRLFEHVPGVMLFVKDADSRLLHANHRFLEHCGAAALADIADKSDFEVFPRYMAEKFRRDDLAVLKSGQPLLDLVELFPTRDRLPEWYHTHKYPMFDHNGKAAGVCGIVRSAESEPVAGDDPVARLVALIKRRFAQPISIPDLSRQAGLSQRQLGRLFKQRFRISPIEYIVRFRVLVAADALRQSNRPITDIAIASGFYDHSSFTRQFKRHMGQLPRDYRRSR